MAAPMIVYESAFSVAVSAHHEHVQSARKMSHDTVIANTGAARRSGVVWTHYPCRDVIAGDADLGDITLPPEIVLFVNLYPAGVLVVATVEVAP